MRIFRFVLISLLAVTILFACNKTETGSDKGRSPAYGTEEAKAPSYGEAKTPAYGEVAVPGYGEVKAPAYGEAKAPSYGEAKAPAYGEVAVPGYGEVKVPAYGGTEGDAPSGAILFSDETLGSSKNAKSCNTCHPGGKGLEMSGSKSKFNIMGREQSSLEAAVNICIVMPLEGKAINPMGKEMKDIVAYIGSLKK